MTPENVFIVNINHIGYCRVYYDYKNSETFINVSSYVNLPVLTRAQIIDDEYHRFVEKKEPSLMWSKIMQYLQKEQEYEAWLPMIRFFEDMSNFLPFSDMREIDRLKETMRLALDGLLRYFDKYESSRSLIFETNSFKSRLLYEVFKWACLLNSQEGQSLADKELKYITKYYKQERNLWQEWIYCDRLRNIKTYTFEKILLASKLKNNVENAFVKYLPCLGFKTTLDILRVKYISFKTYLPLQNDKHIILFHSFVAKHASAYIKDILINLTTIKFRTMKVTTAICIVINHVYSLHDTDKILLFVETSDLLAAQDHLVFDFVRQKIVLRESQIEKHRNNIKNLWHI